MNPEVLEVEPDRRGSTKARLRRLAASDTGRSAGLAAAVIAMNVLALVFTVVFARILGPAGYGSLAALLSAFIILMVPGSALQIATAREVSHAVADGDPNAGHGVRLWLLHLIAATAVVAVLVVPLRGVLGSIIAVDDTWAAAAVPLTGMLWAIVCVERGALQGLQHYKLVGFSLVTEGVARLALALLLVGVGLDVTGAFLGTGAALICVGVALFAQLHSRLPHRLNEGEKRLRDLLAGSRAPVAGLTLLFALQEAHVIVVKHEASSKAAGAYAVAAVAAKAIIWVAVGLGMYLLPEASHRARIGTDARPVLLSTLGLVALGGLPMVLVYALAGEPLLRAVFGEDLTGASAALPWLGLAMTFLACSYLCVQYLLALGRKGFIPVLGIAAIADVVLLAGIGANLTNVAISLCALQAAAAVVILSLSLRRREVEPRPLRA